MDALRDESKTAADHAFHGFAGRGIELQRCVVHRLPNFEPPRLHAGDVGNRFVNVRGHRFRVRIVNRKFLQLPCPRCADVRSAELRSEGKARFSRGSHIRMKSQTVVRNYYVLPCCLLLLNLGVELVSYKAKMFGDPLLRTTAIIAMVLFGGSLVAFVLSPAITGVIETLHRTSRKGGGQVGATIFLVGLGVVVFWLYYRVYIIGPQSVLPYAWRNH